MKKIFIIGAGRSATDLIEYLLNHAEENDWEITVGDYSEALAREKTGNHPRGKAIFFDATNPVSRRFYISSSSLVVSFLPPQMHVLIARDCLEHGSHLVTASYLSAEIAAMDEAVKQKGLIFLNEMGADPGIDHMSAMQNIDAIRAKGGEIVAFKSYCGALVAPESNDNPWGYKFTWSPMNVIVAGQNTARFIDKGKLRYIPYQRLFTSTEKIKVPGMGTFEAYANRDSLAYREKYGLSDLPTMFRATLRYPGFCEVWAALVKVGLTDPGYSLPDSENLTYRQWVSAYISEAEEKGLEQALADYLNTTLDSEVMNRLKWAGLFSEEKIARKNGTPAEILLDLLLNKLSFRQNDTDMLVMVDYFEYKQDGKIFARSSSLVTKGLDPRHTAISRTVGLPAAIGVKLILQEKIKARGVMLPLSSEIYSPVLQELENWGISFVETETEITTPEK
ncbi:MAG: saccharopine dehydrogenase C-terminal domain-containing protein [Bacteroidia bacterium]|nr:saccharopine dehydrogenase C-terminal domain-containing protein [Bacteroidia bacterium]